MKLLYLRSLNLKKLLLQNAWYSSFNAVAVLILCNTDFKRPASLPLGLFFLFFCGLFFFFLPCSSLCQEGNYSRSPDLWCCVHPQQDHQLGESLIQNANDISNTWMLIFVCYRCLVVTATALAGKEHWDMGLLHAAVGCKWQYFTVRPLLPLSL